MYMKYENSCEAVRQKRIKGIDLTIQNDPIGM